MKQASMAIITITAMILWACGRDNGLPPVELAHEGDSAVLSLHQQGAANHPFEMLYLADALFEQSIADGDPVAAAVAASMRATHEGLAPQSGAGDLFQASNMFSAAEELAGDNEQHLAIIAERRSRAERGRLEGYFQLVKMLDAGEAYDFKDVFTERTVSSIYVKSQQPGAPLTLLVQGQDGAVICNKTELSHSLCIWRQEEIGKVRISVVNRFEDRIAVALYAN